MTYKKLCTALAAFLLISTVGLSQKKQRDKESGILQLGMRNTYSMFSNDTKPGIGYGGQFRLRMNKSLNTEWYADILKSEVDNSTLRTDAHIGWSVMFYLVQRDAFVKPYILGGHCFDYTKFHLSEPQKGKTDRWSSAVHLGLGSQFKLNKFADLSVGLQYMNHLGTMLELTETMDDGAVHQHVERSQGLSFEGHLLATASLNVNIIDFMR